MVFSVMLFVSESVVWFGWWDFTGSTKTLDHGMFNKQPKISRKMCSWSSKSTIWNLANERPGQGCRCFFWEISQRFGGRNVSVTWVDVIQKQLVACKEIWIVLHDYLEGKEMSKHRSIRKPGELEKESHTFTWRFVRICLQYSEIAFWPETFSKETIISRCLRSYGRKVKVKSRLFYIYILFILMFYLDSSVLHGFSMKYIEQKVAVWL